MDKFVISTKRKHSESSESESEEEVSTSSKSSSKSKSYDDNRKFQTDWTELYFFIPSRNSYKPICLICEEILTRNKKSNIERHFNSKHKQTIEKLYPNNSECGKLYISQLQERLSKQRSLLKQSLTESECVTFASYNIAMLISKFQ